MLKKLINFIRKTEREFSCHVKSQLFSYAFVKAVLKDTVDLVSVVLKFVIFNISPYKFVYLCIQFILQSDSGWCTIKIINVKILKH